ncbi:MAG TPA: serine--tRNA ligase [Bacteroidales bacterium]|nr:serine--tRNA ligase [Bacteroidales bacterium]
MLEIAFLREQPEVVKEGLNKKHFGDPGIVDRILELDQQRRATQKSLDDALAQGKTMARDIGALMQQGRTEEATAARERTGELKQLARELSEALEKAEAEQDRLLTELPNLPHSSVPAGRHAEDNLVVHQEGELKSQEGLLPHWELAARGRIIDFELGSKISGAGFPVYRGAGARLQRALINFFLEEGIKAGYEEYQPPLVVNAASGFGTGQLPDKEGQMYYVNEDDLYLIPTAEVPVTNFYRDLIVKESELPIRNVAYSSCFRREAGSYGKDVRGLNRLHQFDKVEIVQIEHPARSYETLESMRAHVEGLLRKLELPYRVLLLCGGDMSFTSAKTYDMEVWSAGQGRWLEVSSISNFETFQSNRMKLRFRDGDGKPRLAHTLNGSALALPRIVAALLENNQEGDLIHIPAALQPYTGFAHIRLT